MKKTLSVGLFILAIGSAQAAGFLRLFSSPTKRVLAGPEGSRVYGLVADKPMGNISPDKAARLLKGHLEEMNPALAKEVNNIIEAIDSGRTIPSAHFEELSTYLEIERISKISIEEWGTPSKTHIETKVLLELLAKDSSNEWIVRAVEKGELVVIPEETVSTLARGEGYSGIREFVEAELAQGEYKYITVPLINEKRVFFLATPEGRNMFESGYPDRLNKVLIKKLSEAKREKDKLTGELIATIIIVGSITLMLIVL